MSKILKGIMLSEARSEYGANLDWAAGKASQDTNEPQKYAIEVGPNKYVGDIYTDWNEADRKRKELAKKYFQVKVVPISKMNEAMAENSMPYPHGKPESGDKITWYHSNHYPEIEGTVLGWKDGHLIVQSVDPQPRNTEKTVAKYRVPKNNILSVKKQGVSEGLDEAMNEDVGGNYLYHATGGLKSILQSGAIDPAKGPQESTTAQTKLPTVSTTRDWGYASGSNAQAQESGGISRHAVIVLDRNAVEQRYKTLGTSQSRENRGLAFPKVGNLSAGKVARSYDINKSGHLTKQDADDVFAKGTITSYGKPVSRQEVGQRLGQAKKEYYTPKAGGEFEEAIVVPKTGLPIARTMVGFWINPKSELMNDPAIMNDPRRLELAPGGTGRFIKAASAPKVRPKGQLFDKNNPDHVAAMNATTQRERELQSNATSQQLDYERELRGMAESSEEKKECGNCHGSGRMVWDADIGTDQECFVCDGTGEVDWNDDEKDDVKEGADIEYIVVIRDEQGKRSIRISALTPTDAKEKAESQGYKVIKVKDPSDSHYFNFKEGSVTSTFKIGPKSEYDKGKADSYYKRGDRSDESPDPKEYLRGYDENDELGDYKKYRESIDPRKNKLSNSGILEGLGLPYLGTYEQERGVESADEKLDEKWSDKYKRSIDCSHPKGFSQRAHCQGKKKK